MARYTLTLGKDMDKVLDKLAAQKDLTKAEVIRRAVASYNVLMKESNRKGLKVSLTTDEDKVVKDIVLA